MKEAATTETERKPAEWDRDRDRNRNGIRAFSCALFGRQYICCHIKCIIFWRTLSCIRSISVGLLCQLILTLSHLEACNATSHGMSCSTFLFHISLSFQGENVTIRVFFFFFFAFFSRRLSHFSFSRAFFSLSLFSSGSSKPVCKRVPFLPLPLLFALPFFFLGCFAWRNVKREPSQYLHLSHTLHLNFNAINLVSK